MVVGGVAGGASCVARARRLSEIDDIIMFDRGEYVSFANCGLPYYVGDVIKEEENLIVATPEMFRKRFKIDVRLHSEVVAVDRKNSRIQIKDIKTGEVFSNDNIRSIRPGFGLHSRYLEIIIGRSAKQDIKRGTPLDWKLI